MALLPSGLAKSGVEGFYPKEIAGSLRFNDDDSAYLSWTPASAGNRKTWTWSAWVKRGNLGSTQFLFGGGSSTRTDIYFDTDNNFNIAQFGGMQLEPNQVFRDPSAWYHIVIAVDTTQATAANRAKMYINGVEMSSFKEATYPSQNADLGINDNTLHRLGARAFDTSNTLDGYMAEVHFIDGQALDADDFGETKSGGVWVAKDYTGTYGTNGFHLDFANSADIGNDVSGNGNDWTPNNFTASDVVSDSPTDNFATLNPFNGGYQSTGTLSDGNLRVTTNNAGTETYGTMAIPSSGQYYWEATVEVSNNAYLGIALLRYSSSFTRYRYLNDGQKDVNGTTSSYGDSFGAGDVIGVAVDADAETIEFYKNGTGQGSFSIDLSLGDFFPVFMDGNSGASSTFVVNFGQQDFTYTPPTGYLALSTANLPDPAIDPAEDESPADHFGTLLWTGNTDTGTRTITDATSGVTGEVNFTPDWVWTKSRSATGSHALFDVVRGANKYLTSNGTGAEITDPSSGYLDSFTDGGFVAQEGSSNFANLNTNGTTYVAWNWKANGTGVSNTDGSITSTVSANTTSGFAVVKYVGTQTAGDTVGHGLSSPPEMIIVKNLDYARNWIVYHKYAASDAETDHLHLNTTDALVDSSADWDDTAPTSTVFSLGNGTDTNDSSGGGAEHIAYCFHSVDGFSSIGSYSGNGSSDGPFIYTGFRPSWILLKRTTSTYNWSIQDTKRDPFNVADAELYPNDSSAETTLASYDILSNGFKIRTTSGAHNSSGVRYIYMAFAENPFKYSNAR